ncbi:hypothetical protein KI688_004600 [Linnemannia hyalina]|uniref:Polysaccharide lyase 14 domain-containing protein n=1 Tax=Linnemannia hyalina TaxID=64524 RepID=A0A9P7XKE8_9FUNG|nr:hypothetical protein KI688_004600 [Linnemannia hyalina]
MSILLLTSTGTGTGTATAAAAAATPLTRDQIYAQGGFLQNWVAPMPNNLIQTSTVNPTNNGEKYLVQNWATTYHTIQIGGQDISFVSDPFPAATTNSTTVLQLTYPKGSYAPSIGPVMGGAQFYAKPFGDTTPFSKMLISYDVAFPVGFDWVLAGKLPGIYGGTPYDGCSGGVQSTGANCLTMRMMWRQNGVGEVYAYVPADPKSAFCKDSQVLCNDQYGKSIGRGQIFFQPGVWTRLDMVMELNEPAGNSNGTLEVYQNGNLVVQMNNIPYRSSGMVGFQGLLFSSFFGGSDPTYATPVDTQVYFRNFQLSVGAPAILYEGTGGSGATGRAMIGGSSLTMLGAATGFVFVLVSTLFI